MKNNYVDMKEDIKLSASIVHGVPFCSVVIYASFRLTLWMDHGMLVVGFCFRGYGVNTIALKCCHLSL